MSDVVIRDTTFEDIPKLRAMHGASWRETYPNSDHGVSQKPIDLEVVTYNGRAKAFYRKYNFDEIPGTEVLFAEKIPVITMIRKGGKS